MRPHQRRPMWQSVLQPLPREWCNSYFPLCLTAAPFFFFTPDPVVNSTKKDRWQTEADLFDGSHPSIALCSSPSSKSCQSGQLHSPVKKKKGSSCTCQLIDGVEGASLGCHCCSAPPTRQQALRFHFKWASWHPSPFLFFCFLSTRWHLRVSLRQHLSCRDR